MGNTDKIIKIFERLNVLQKGHFLLTSGRHSDKYLQCARLLEHPNDTETVCRIMAEKFKDDNIETVVAPAMGGIIVAYEIARILGARAIFAEREDGKMTLRRGFALKHNERVLVVEDVVTTGGSVREVISLAKQADADIAGVGCLVDRTGGKIDFGYTFQAALSLAVESWQPEECPLCRDGIPAIKPGSRQISKN